MCVRKSISKRFFHEFVDHFAKLTPDAIAVVAGTESLSYAQLIDRANRLAHRLLADGVGKNSLVALCVERSIHMIVGVLAIQKAGAAYVPLDPAYPPERLAYMLDDSKADCVITDSSTHTLLPEHTASSIVIDTFDGASFSSITPNVPIDGSDVAYVIYTSGSTGVPKGVVVEHQSLTSFIGTVIKRFTKEQTAYVIGVSSLSFDLSVWDMTAALTTGGTLVLVRNVLDLISQPPSFPISIMMSVPSAVAEVVRAKKLPSSLKTLMLAGEATPRALADAIYATTDVTELINAWGVTEDTVYSTMYTVPREGVRNPPIGAAIDGRVIFLMDADGKPVPVGTPGELYCAGEGVARGYLGREELTNEKFIIDPATSERMYRTGDLAEEDADGNIHYIGRSDLQVKIRGYRIELGEIESVLAQHPNIAQVAVVAENSALTACIVQRGTPAVTKSAIDEYLATRVPKQMIPSALILLDALPVGPTGKIDRKSLQEAARNRSTAGPTYAAPRDAMEEQLATLFSTILDIPQVGIDDNFFALGGQSLQATRALTEIRQTFPTECAKVEAVLGGRGLIMIFWKDSTIKHIAAALQGKAGDFHSDEVVPGIRCLQIGTSKQQTPLFLLHGIIGGEGFYSLRFAQALGPEATVYGVAPHGENGAPIPETIELMAADFLAKIRVVQPHGPYKIVGFCNGGLVGYEIAQMLKLAGETVEHLVMIAVPGRNIRFQNIATFVDALRWIPGMSVSKRRRTFVTLRNVSNAMLHLARHRFNLADFLRSSSKLSANNTEGDEIYQARRRSVIHSFRAYAPQPYDGRLSLLFGKEDEFAKVYTPFDDWKKIAPQLEPHWIPGDHHFIENSPQAVLDVVTI